MNRNIITPSIILRTNRMGEIHKTVSMITPGHGIIRGIAHGAYRGRNRFSGTTDPFTFNTVYLYVQPVKDSWKITDIEVKSWFYRIRESIFRLQIASLFAEVLLISHGGGERSNLFFNLLYESMEELDACPEEQLEYVIIQFIWRYLHYSGIKPELNSCGACGRLLERGEPVFYSRRDTVFVCDNCVFGETLSLSPGGRAYLQRIERCTLANSRNILMDRDSMKMTKRSLLLLLQDSLESELKTLIHGELLR